MKIALQFWVCFLFTTIALAQQPASPKKTTKKIIKTTQAPQPIGPYSQAVAANGFLFVAGQIGINSQTRQLVTASIEAEATQVLENIKEILKAADLDFRHVVKATIYVKDISQFAKINEVYGKYFVSDPPARETVQVVNLPASANIEISVVAAME